MTYELTKEEKIAIVEQHLKNLLLTEYNNLLTLLELNAAEEPDQNSIENMNKQMQNATAQKAALESELNLLKTESAS